MNRVRFGVVGCGFVGAPEARFVHSHPNARVVAVTGGRGNAATQLTAELGCEYEPTVSSLVARRDVDAVIVASPSRFHEEHVVAAAMNGKHIFLEMPMALSIQSCDAIIEALKHSGVVFMLGAMMHFYNGFRRMKTMLDQGAVGKPLLGFAVHTAWQPPQDVPSWKTEISMSGGHLFHHMHEIDLLRWFLGDVKNVFARTRTLTDPQDETHPHREVILISMEFEKGALGSVEQGSAFHLGERVVRIAASGGAFRVDLPQSRILCRREGAADVEFPVFDDPEANHSIMELFQRADNRNVYGRPGSKLWHFLARAIGAELDSFVKVLTTGVIETSDRWMFDPAQGRANVIVAESAWRSAQTCQPIEISQ